MKYNYGECFPQEYWRMESEFMHLYPRYYHEMYPVISEVIDEKDDPWRYPVPHRRLVDEMTEECIRRLHKMGYYYDDGNGKNVKSQQFTGRGLFRSLVAVILLSELLRRRRRLFF